MGSGDVRHTQKWGSFHVFSVIAFGGWLDTRLWYLLYNIAYRTRTKNNIVKRNNRTVQDAQSCFFAACRSGHVVMNELTVRRWQKDKNFVNAVTRNVRKTFCEISDP